MKTIYLLVAAAIIVTLGIALFVQNNKDNGTEPKAADGFPSQSVVESTTSPEASVVFQFTLQTIADGGKLLFQGVGGEIDGLLNPDLSVPAGTMVEITLINADGMPHNIFLPDFNAQSSYVAKIGDQTKITFQVSMLHTGSHVYYCEVPGHRQAGQEGKLIVVQP